MQQVTVMRASGSECPATSIPPSPEVSAPAEAWPSPALARQSLPGRLCCPALSQDLFRDLLMPPRMLPEPTPETRHFWDGCREGELRLQRCTECDGGSYFPPRPFCPRCGSRQVEVFKASGKGVLWSYVINHRPRPDMGDQPY